MEPNLHWLLVEFYLTNGSKLGHFVREVTVWWIAWRKEKRKFNISDITSLVNTIVTLYEEKCSILTERTLDRTAGGWADLAAVFLNALGQLYEGGVSGEPVFSSRWRKEFFGTIFYRWTGLQDAFILGLALRCGVFQVWNINVMCSQLR